MARTDTLGNFLTDVAEAIRNKKGTTDTIKASDFDTEIASLPSGGGADLSEYFNETIKSDGVTTNTSYEIVKNMIKKVPPVIIPSSFTDTNYMFNGLTCTEAPSVSTESNSLTRTTYMYANTKIDYVGNLDGMDTSNVTTISSMFYGSTIKSFTFPKWNLNKLTDWSSMFANCSKLEYADLTNMKMDTPSGNSSATTLFDYCYLLKTIIYPSQIVTTGTTSTRILRNHWRSCYSLTKIVIPCETGVVPLYDNTQFNTNYHFTGTVNETYNPDGLKDGKIYVPDNLVDSYKTTQYWSTYADCIFPISDLDN